MKHISLDEVRYLIILASFHDPDEFDNDDAKELLYKCRNLVVTDNNSVYGVKDFELFFDEDDDDTR